MVLSIQTAGPNAAQWGIVIGASLTAFLLDVRTRRIPNWLTLPLAAAGLVAGFITGGLTGLGSSVAAWAVLMLPYFLLFALAGGGAGDAKMMGAIGAWLGLKAGLVVLACVAIVGGIFGVLRILAHRERRSAFAGLYAWLYVLMVASCSGPGGWTLLKNEVDEEKTGVIGGPRLTIPYGPAIFIGVLIGAGVVHSWNG